MTARFFIHWRLPILAVAVIVAAIATGTTASAESADGWAATGPESKVFLSQRDDGRTVGVYARPAKKGANTGILVRLTLTGFTDKKLALQKDELPEHFFGPASSPIRGRAAGPTPPFHKLGRCGRA